MIRCLLILSVIVFAVGCASLSPKQKEEAIRHFHSAGMTPKQPNPGFAQPEWTLPEGQQPWDTSDLTSLAFWPEDWGMDFDVYVDNVEFY